jgi:hypothetical protein
VCPKAIIRKAFIVFKVLGIQWVVVFASLSLMSSQPTWNLRDMDRKDEGARQAERFGCWSGTSHRTRIEAEDAEWEKRDHPWRNGGLSTSGHAFNANIISHIGLLFKKAREQIIFSHSVINTAS